MYADIAINIAVQENMDNFRADCLLILTALIVDTFQGFYYRSTYMWHYYNC